MPKFSTSARHSFHQDGKKKSKHRGHQYRDAAKARKLKQTRFKGIVEEVIEPIESGKPRPLKRAPVINLAKIGRRVWTNGEESQPLSTPIIPAEVYAPNVSSKVPRVIIPTSEATAQRKKATATDDDGDTTDVDDSEDLIVVPAGFVEVAEMLGLLNNSAAPPKEFEEPPSALHAQSDESQAVVETRSTRIETPLNSPPLAVPQIISSVPSPFSSTQPSHMFPEPGKFEVIHDASQTAAATSPTAYVESSEPSAPISVPHSGSAPESFQEVSWSSACQFQHPTTWQNNMNDAEAFRFHQQNVQNHFYPGSTDDVDMEYLGEAAMELSVYESVPTMWTSPQPQPENQMYYNSHVGQVADNINQNHTYAMDDIHANWPTMPVQNELMEQFAQINQPHFNHPQPANPFTTAYANWPTLPVQSESTEQFTQISQPGFDHPQPVDPFTAACNFWATFSGIPSTPQPPTIVPEIITSTLTPDDEQQPEPSEVALSDPPIYQDNQPEIRLANDNSFHPCPYLRGRKNMKFISMSVDSEESQVVQPVTRRRRPEKPPFGSEMDLIARLKIEAEGLAGSQVKHRHRERRHKEGPAHISNSDLRAPPRLRRRAEPGTPKPKTLVPSRQKSHKRNWQREGTLEGTSSPTLTEWSFSSAIFSLTNRLLKLF